MATQSEHQGKQRPQYSTKNNYRLPSLRLPYAVAAKIEIVNNVNYLVFIFNSTGTATKGFDTL